MKEDLTDVTTEEAVETGEMTDAVVAVDSTEEVVVADVNVTRPLTFNF
jgi:hypothetical protein